MLIRLKEPCIIAGRMCVAGDVVRLPDGVMGPHRAVHSGHDLVDFGNDRTTQGARIFSDVVDVPLYDVINENEEGYR